MPRPDRSQEEAPYLDALRAYAARNPGRFHVPGHKGGPGADPAPDRGDRRASARARHPRADVGHRRGRGADPVPAGAAAGRRGVGGEAQLVPDQRRLAGQPRGLSRACAHAGRRWWSSATRTRARSTRFVLSGLRPTFVAPELDPELFIAHCLTPEALDAALARHAGRGGGAGGLADLLRRGRRRGRAGRGRARARRAADRGRGVGRAPRLPPRTCRRTRSRWAPTW